ncbi:hypothetical protein [Paenisporosarcina sp. OV554]|uniref:hypothetical protein n=1 Tax=Paenisporosarcina sp. OV554 TaxID=2135694 RepID=UPI000D3CE559|nr:hypothetical protein [Paenisporosarcina sp. OV554]PUB09841.1 hypothetical protein C8K15_12430 [Paenisporosarcina sp. OV554]
MLKTIKGKVIAGTVSVVLLSSAGVAFASSNAGANLKDWYDGQFGVATSNIVGDVESNVSGRINGLATEYEGLKTAAGSSISTDGTNATNTASGNIETETQGHIDSINAKQTQIEGYMNGQFAALKFAANGLINQAGNAALGYANNDLTIFTGAKGDAARATLTSELEADTTAAVSELEQAIEEAKGELQAKLDTKEAATTAEIIAAIDAKIVELRGKITAKRDALVAAQKLLIDAKALELETAAKAELQGVVDGI